MSKLNLWDTQDKPTILRLKALTIHRKTGASIQTYTDTTVDKMLTRIHTQHSVTQEARLLSTLQGPKLQADAHGCISCQALEEGEAVA